MIIRTSFRAPGGLGAHLERGDTNERVELCVDLCQGCELDIRVAINEFAALGTDIDTSKSLIHFVVSPDVALLAEQEKTTVGVLLRAYDISNDQPMLVVKHAKPGEFGRPPHYHIIIPRRDFLSGKLIRDSYYKLKNDRVAVQLDAAFSNSVVPVVHKRAVENWFKNNDPAILENISRLGGIVTPSRPTPTATALEKQRAADDGVDLENFWFRVFAVANGKRTPNRLAWAAAGLRLARGDKAVMIVDLATGHCSTLVRALNAGAKRTGDPQRWRESNVLKFLENDTPSLSAVVAASKESMNRKKINEPLDSTEYAVENVTKKMPDQCYLASQELKSNFCQNRAEASFVSKKNDENSLSDCIAIKKRGRPWRATPADIRHEIDCQKRITEDIQQVKKTAAAYRQIALAIGQEIAEMDWATKCALNVGGVAGFVMGGAAGAAAAVFLIDLLRRRKRRKRTERLKAAASAGDVRARLDAYFGALREDRPKHRRSRAIRGMSHETGLGD
jgi:hypothetical protein